MKIYVQGDVAMMPVTALPANATPVKNKGRIVLAYGENTGHAHAVSVKEAKEFTMADAGNVVRRFLSVASAATVKHEEHAAIKLPAGIYEIVTQREYHPESIRNIAD